MKTLHIAPHELETFHKLLYDYVTDPENSDKVLNSGINCITEKLNKEEPFRLFVDVDFDAGQFEGMDIDDVMTLVKETLGVCINVVRDAIGDEDSPDYLLGKRNLYKFHIHFVDVIVTDDTAKNLAAEMVRRFRAHPSYKDNVIDSSVYNTGLRMIWCNKGTMEKRLDEKIVEHEKVFGEGTYEHWYELVDPETFEPQEKWLGDLKNTSIFAHGRDVTELTTFDHAPVEENKTKSIVKAEKEEKMVKHDGGHTNVALPNTKAFVENLCGFPLHGNAKVYRETCSIVWNSNRREICPFKKAKHKGNNIYILIDPKGIHVRCHDEDCSGKEKMLMVMSGVPENILQELNKIVVVPQRELICNVERQLHTLRKDYPHNGFNVDYEHKVYIDDVVAKIKLTDLYCLTCKRYHEDPQTFLECYAQNGQVMLRCARDVWSSQLLMFLSRLATNNLFQINQNFFTTINNYGTDAQLGNGDFGPFQSFPRIFEDDTLNRLCHNTLIDDGSTSTFAEFTAELMLHRMEYIYVQNQWYRYTGKYWRKCRGPDHFIYTVVASIYSGLKEHYTREVNVKWLTAFAHMLCHKAKRKAYVDELEGFFVDMKDIAVKLDSKPHLIGFQNGVFDSEDCTFRAHRKEDFLTHLLSYDLPTKSDPEIRKSIEQFFNDIQPNREQRQFFLLDLSLHLEGFNNHNTVVIYTGTGGNGKSLVSKLMKVAFEHLHTEPSATFLTSERPSDERPCPNIVDLKNKRSVFASEPEAGKKINGGFIKFLSGKDLIKVRNCHSNEHVEFTPLFKVTLLCNTIPLISGGEDDLGALWRRIKIIDFPIQFVANPKTKMEKKADNTLDRKMNSWGPELMLMFIEIYTEYVRGGRVLEVPKCVEKNVELQRRANNKTSDFLHEILVKNTEKKVRHGVHTHKLVELFNVWAMKRFSRSVASELTKTMSMQNMNKALKEFDGGQSNVSAKDCCEARPTGVKGYKLNEQVVNELMGEQNRVVQT